MDNENLLQDWLVHFGTLLTELQPETESIGGHAIGTGRLKVKMKLESHIPQLVPIHGQKVRFYYRDIKKLCTNCYNSGHYKSDCNNEKKQWLTFVADFMEKFPEIDKTMYGKWATIIENEVRRVQQGKDSTLVTEIMSSRSDQQQENAHEQTQGAETNVPNENISADEYEDDETDESTERTTRNKSKAAAQKKPIKKSEAPTGRGRGRKIK